MAVVYRHRRLDTNEIFYVGIGKRKTRAYSKSSRNKMWMDITNKTEYSIEILAEDLELEDAKELEIFLIQEYGRKILGTGKLVNITDGGDYSNTNQGKKFSYEHKQKISQAHKGKLISEETKKRISESKQNKSDEEKKAIGLKISKSKEGSTLTESHKLKISLFSKTEKSPLFQANVKNSKSLIVENKEYKSIREAQRLTGFSREKLRKIYDEQNKIT